VRTLREIQPNFAVLYVRPPGVAAYLTAPLLLFAAALPWLSQSASVPWAAGAGLGVILLTALAFVRPVRRRVALDASCLLRLEALNDSDDPSYQVVLCRGGREEPLLEHTSLHVVARDLGRILDVTGLPLENALGIPAEYLRSTGKAAVREREALTIFGISSASERRAARAVVGGALFATFVFGSSLLRASSPVSTLSIALPTLSVLLLAMFGAWMMSKRSSVRISSDGIEVEEIALGQRRRVLTIPAHELLGACTVEHGELALQVLFATTRGPRTLPLFGDAARRVAAAVGRVPGGTGVRDANGPPAGSRDEDAREGRSSVPSVRGANEARRDSRRASRPEVARARQS
jgi:hypothetical protein